LVDAFSRTRVVTGASERFIAYSGPPKYYAFRNLGPGKIVLSIWGDVNTNPANYEIRSGDYAEFFCALAEVKLATGETLDGSVLQWSPA
jgi:hypothetical protein